MHIWAFIDQIIRVPTWIFLKEIEDAKHISISWAVWVHIELGKTFFTFFLSDKYYYKRINSYVQIHWQFNIIINVCTGSKGQKIIFMLKIQELSIYWQ